VTGGACGRAYEAVPIGRRPGRSQSSCGRGMSSSRGCGARSRRRKATSRKGLTKTPPTSKGRPPEDDDGVDDPPSIPASRREKNERKKGEKNDSSTKMRPLAAPDVTYLARSVHCMIKEVRGPQTLGGGKGVGKDSREGEHPNERKGDVLRGPAAWVPGGGVGDEVCVRCAGKGGGGEGRVRRETEIDKSRRPRRRRAPVREEAASLMESLWGYPLDVLTHRTLW